MSFLFPALTTSCGSVVLYVSRVSRFSLIEQKTRNIFDQKFRSAEGEKRFAARTWSMYFDFDMTLYDDVRCLFKERTSHIILVLHLFVASC